MSLTDWQYVMLATFATALYAVFLLFTRRATRDKAVLWGWLGLVGAAYAAIVAVPLLIPMVRDAIIAVPQAYWISARDLGATPFDARRLVGHAGI